MIQLPAEMRRPSGDIHKANETVGMPTDLIGTPGASVRPIVTVTIGIATREAKTVQIATAEQTSREPNVETAALPRERVKVPKGVRAREALSPT
jgi:hypothetical protein